MAKKVVLEAQLVLEEKAGKVVEVVLVEKVV